MTALRSLFVFALCSPALSGMTHADTLHAARDGSYWHHDSGWVFEQRIAGFERIGAPQDVAGSTDVVAHYASEDEGVRVTAIVDIYDQNSAINDATFANASESFEQELGSTAHEALSPTQLEVGGTRNLAATKTAFRLSDGARTSNAVLYFVDAGDWLVKIRVTTPESAIDSPQAADAFVRDQRWDTLGAQSPP